MFKCRVLAGIIQRVTLIMPHVQLPKSTAALAQQGKGPTQNLVGQPGTTFDSGITRTNPHVSCIDTSDGVPFL